MKGGSTGEESSVVCTVHCVAWSVQGAVDSWQHRVCRGWCTVHTVHCMLYTKWIELCIAVGKVLLRRKKDHYAVQ